MFVVDDEPDLREVVRLNLELQGHEVEVAADGAAALAAVADGLRPDLVMLDLTMPGVDGLEVLRRLKADPDPDIAATPVVLLTGRSGELDRIRGGIEGALSHLTKPVAMAALTQVVTDSLEADEAEARLAAQTSALRQLVRLEKGETDEGEPGHDQRIGSRVRFSRLERRPDQPPGPASTPASDGPTRAGAVLELSRLSPKQQEVLRAVGGHPTVRLASAQLGVSRSNVYASLRRIAAKLDVASVQELVVLARERAG
ncbi:MAG: hypothetical protein AVDCRST_MAG76-3740 [uncultured Acidimicrobiales bacterium]|uniref:Response regulatory domain-containing protein n=1 Tax=uncultured Acidimicrobiales bacterium TaxID=310071 RepID=A0A6J4JDL9_9ACTN|nr:MAG: hypothetical protein AVDCRST_MAG76-3740 [uncultured Acidimicrobiales bacterium]